MKRQTFQDIIEHLDLDPYEARIYHRILWLHQRKGYCDEGISWMSTTCQMSDRKCRLVIKSLEDKEYIEVRNRKGDTNVYEPLVTP